MTDFLPDIDTTTLLFNIMNGLIIGAFYVLMALGLSLILNLSNVINFAHGGFLVIGGYIAYTVTPYVGFWGALLIAPPLTAVIGLVVERILIRPLYGRDPLYSLLLTFGLAFIIEDGTRFFWGAQGKPVTIPDFLAQPLSDDFFFITGYRLFMVAMVAAAVTLLFVLLRHTRLGIRIRAGTLDLETVSALGINVGMLRSMNFAVGIFLAGLSGVLAAGQLGLEPTMGTGLLMPSFIAIIVGGVGSLVGTLFGGLLIGVASGMTAVFLPSASEAIMYVMMAIVLLIRPRGLFGEEGMLEASKGNEPQASDLLQQAQRRLMRLNLVRFTVLALTALEEAVKGADALLGQWRWRGLFLLTVIWAVLISAPYWMPFAGAYTALGTRVLVLALAAMSVNFLLGFTGVLSFGHAAWFGLGAYGAGLALKFLAPSTPLAILAGMLLAGLAGGLLGALLVRRRGVYFAMVTIAFGQVFYYIAFQWSSLTGGDDGLRGFSRQPLDAGAFSIDILNNADAFYWFVLFFFGLLAAVMALILRSPFGRTMVAIRENERRARFLGVAVERHIWIVFTLSCFFMGVAGALYALTNNFADPRGLHYSQSGDFVMMAVMGGMRTFWGPLIGAAVFVVLQDYLSSVTVNWMSFVGLLFVLVVLFFPRGLLGVVGNRGQA
jgi:branched-chain amino acid transport system permease protein